MQTIFCNPSHVVPQEFDAPRYMDQIGNAVPIVRRKRIRGQSCWEINAPGTAELLDTVWGLLEYLQGDRIFWFDGAGFGEVVSPVPIWIGDTAGTADIMLPHKHVFIASLVVYYNGSVNPNWSPIGGDGVTCDAINMPGIPLNGQITAKYRRKIKALLRVEEKPKKSRGFRDPVINANTIHNLTFMIEEYLG